MTSGLWEAEQWPPRRLRPNAEGLGIHYVSQHREIEEADEAMVSNQLTLKQEDHPGLSSGSDEIIMVRKSGRGSLSSESEGCQAVQGLASCHWL